MSKYMEMAEAVKKVRQKWEQYREACFKDAATLVNGFASYCEIPQGHIFHSPLDKEREEGRTYTIIGGMHYGKDHFWHLGLGLTISGQRILLDVGITQNKGKTVVRLFSNGQPREIDVTNESQRNAFYDTVVQQITNYFDADALDDLDGATTKRIGFHL